MTEHHHAVRYCDSSGYVASCGCGWRSTRKTREQREEDAHRHQLEGSLVVRQIEPDAEFQVEPP